MNTQTRWLLVVGAGADETVKRAITQGIDPAGDPLDWPMPRWRMSERDLDDLLDYLKTLE